MALIKCKECGQEISDTAKVCIKCGAKTEMAKAKEEKNKRTATKVVIIALIVIALLACVTILRSVNPLHQYSRQAIEVLEQLRDKEITEAQAETKIDKIQSKVYEEYNKNNNNDYLRLSICVSSISTKLYLDKLDSTDKSEINELIWELRKY